MLQHLPTWPKMRKDIRNHALQQAQRSYLKVQQLEVSNFWICASRFQLHEANMHYWVQSPTHIHQKARKPSFGKPKLHAFLNSFRQWICLKPEPQQLTISLLQNQQAHNEVKLKQATNTHIILHPNLSHVYRYQILLHFRRQKKKHLKKTCPMAKSIKISQAASSGLAFSCSFPLYMDPHKPAVCVRQCPWGLFGEDIQMG